MIAGFLRTRETRTLTGYPEGRNSLPTPPLRYGWQSVATLSRVAVYCHPNFLGWQSEAERVAVYCHPKRHKPSKINSFRDAPMIYEEYNKDLLKSQNHYDTIILVMRLYERSTAYG